MNHLLITNFLVDETRLAQELAANILNSSDPKPINWANFNTDLDQSQIEHFTNSKQILRLATQSKEDLAPTLMPLFIRYDRPTYLILGSLSKISLPMQQGLLRFVEEPPSNLNLILTARTKSQALTTIISRCDLRVLPTHIALKYINREKNSELTVGLPEARDFIQDLIQNQKIQNPNFKNVSREGLEIWLWQLEYFVSEVILKNGSNLKLAHIFENILSAKKLNQASVLNRLVWAQLLI